MSQTDRQTDKTTRWAFTAFQEQYHLFDTMPELINMWGWQKEIAPDTQREHYQGYIQTKRQCRFKQLKDILPGVHIEPARDWLKLLQYCKKQETAILGSSVFQTNTSKHVTMTDALLKLAAHVPFRAPLTEEQHLSNQIDKIIKQRIESEYDEALFSILQEDDKLVSMYANNSMRSAWNTTRTYYLAKAQHEAEWADEPPEQTPKTQWVYFAKVPAFEN